MMSVWQTILRGVAFFQRWFLVILPVWALVTLLYPPAGLWLNGKTSYLLGVILFGMGLTLSGDDFARIFKRPIPVILGTVAHYVIMPGLAYLLVTLFLLQGELAVGVILVGSCPSGTSSSVMAFLAGGDVALDVSIGMLSTLLAPVMIPFLVKFLAHGDVSFNANHMFISTLEIVILPLAAGALCHQIFHKHLKPITQILPGISQLAILLIVGCVVALNHAKLMSTTVFLILAVVMLHNLLGYALGYVASRLMGLKLPQQKALTFEVGMQDSALGATLAATCFKGMALVAAPSAIFSLWHNISGATLAWLWRVKKTHRS